MGMERSPGGWKEGRGAGWQSGAARTGRDPGRRLTFLQGEAGSHWGVKQKRQMMIKTLSKGHTGYRRAWITQAVCPRWRLEWLGLGNNTAGGTGRGKGDVGYTLQAESPGSTHRAN